MLHVGLQPKAIAKATLKAVPEGKHQLLLLLVPMKKKLVARILTGDFDEPDFPPSGSKPLAPFVSNVSDNEEPTTVDSADDVPEAKRAFPTAAHAIADTLRRNPPRRRRGFNRHYEDSSGPETNDDELDPYDTFVVTKEKEKAKIAQNPPTYVILKRPGQLARH